MRLIPRDHRLRANTAGRSRGKLYLIDTAAGTAAPVFDFATLAKGGWPQVMRMTADGRRLIISMNQAGKVVRFDTSDPAAPKALKVLDFGPESGSHYIALTKAERRASSSRITS